MNQEETVGILKTFQNNIKNAIEQRSCHLDVDLEKLKRALESLKLLYSDIEELFENIIYIVDNSLNTKLSSNKYIFNLASFDELNQKLMQVFTYIKGKI